LQPGDPSDVIDIGDADMDGLLRFDGLIVGAPTWNTGSDEMRSMTDWDDKLDSIRELSLKGKSVAVFTQYNLCRCFVDAHVLLARFSR
jgi:flavodoxin I